MPRAAGREDDIDIAHNHISKKVDGGTSFDPADDLLGCASLDGSIRGRQLQRR